MSCWYRLPASLILMFGVGVAVPDQSNAIELTGAWASQTDLCKLVFTKKGNRVAFAEFSDLFGSGFIIDGNRMTGRSTRCSIKSRKQDGENLELSATCATSIMSSKVRFRLQVVDDNNILRAFDEIPGMTLKYSRCAM
jgi:hypothetical protein